MRRVVPAVGLWVALGLLARPAPASAGEAGWETFHVKLLLTVLAYDRQLAQHAGGPLVVGVLYRPGQPDSETRRAAVSASITTLGREMQFHGRPLTVAAVPFTGDAAALEGALASQSVNALYLTPGLTPPELAAITATTRRRDVRTLSADAAYVGQGAGVAVVVRGDRPKLLINLGAIREEGADLPARVLRLADVLGEPGGPR